MVYLKANDIFTQFRIMSLIAQIKSGGTHLWLLNRTEKNNVMLHQQLLCIDTFPWDYILLVCSKYNNTDWTLQSIGEKESRL